MPPWLRRYFKISLVLSLLAALLPEAFSATSAVWTGVLRDPSGKALSDATVTLSSIPEGHVYTAKTSATGTFVFTAIDAGEYELSVTTSDATGKAANPVKIQ